MTPRRLAKPSGKFRIAFGALIFVICSSSCGASAFGRPSPLFSSQSRLKPGRGASFRCTDKMGPGRKNFGSKLVNPNKIPRGGVALNLAVVNQFYHAFPLLAAFITCGIKASTADGLAQLTDKSTTRFSKRRNLAMLLYSGLVLGVICELMYNTVYPKMFGATESFVRTLKITLFDGFINAPFLWLPPAYFVKALVFGYPFKEGLSKYLHDIREEGLLKKYWSIWLPVTLFNFSVVPSHLRVACMAAVSFFWMIILSMVSNKTEEKLETPQNPEALPQPAALEVTASVPVPIVVVEGHTHLGGFTNSTTLARPVKLL